jgi:tetratricopeptide (TPR) repeat protein
VIEIENDLRRADALIDVNRPQEALRIVSAVIATAPDNVRAYCLAARCHSMTGNHQMMLAAATQATVHGPANEWGHRLRSMALRNLGRHEEAVAAAMTAVHAAPQIWQPYINLTEALLKFPDPERRKLAYEAASRAVQLAPDSSSTHVTLGRLYASIGEREAALACYERALAISPSDATAHTNLAILDLNRGRLTRAGRNLRSVAASNPGVETYANNVGVAANHWYARVLDIGAVICLVQLLAQYFLPVPLGGFVALGSVALYLIASIAMYARLPQPMRILVRQNFRASESRIATALLALAFILVTLPSIEEAVSGSRPGTGVANVILFPIMLVIRFHGRIQQMAQPYLLRRRYRATVLGGAAAPVIPPQRPAP